MSIPEEFCDMMHCRVKQQTLQAICNHFKACAREGGEKAKNNDGFVFLVVNGVKHTPFTYDCSSQGNVGDAVYHINVGRLVLKEPCSAAVVELINAPFVTVHNYETTLQHLK